MLNTDKSDLSVAGGGWGGDQNKVFCRFYLEQVLALIHCIYGIYIYKNMYSLEERLYPLPTLPTLGFADRCPCRGDMYSILSEELTRKE